jgi:hypothetical protein
MFTDQLNVTVMPPKGKKAKSSDDALAKKSKDLILLPSYHRRCVERPFVSAYANITVLPPQMN